MAAVLGRMGAVGVGIESSHGTAVARALWYRVTELSGHIQAIDSAPRQHSQGPAVTHGGMPIAHTDGNIVVSGLAFTVPAYYNDDCLALLYAAMGAVLDGGSGPSSWTHTFTLAGTLPSCTIEAIEGADAAAATSAVVAAGAVCSQLVWTIQPGSTPSTIATTWNAQKDAGDTTAGSPSFGSDAAPVMYHQIGDLSWNSITIDKDAVRSATITITNGLSDDRFALGSQYRQEPYLTGDRVVTCEIAMERAQADTLRASYTSRASSSLTFTVTDGSKSAAFTFYAARIMTFGRTWSVDGIVMQTVLFRAFAVSGGANGLQIVITNDVEHYDGS